MKERLYYILMNILEKLETSINVERITDNEIDTLFGSASGTGTDAQDYVVEHGTATASDGSYWIYRKWNSGIAECWGRKKETKSQYDTMGSSYGMWWEYWSDVYYPFSFTETPIAFSSSDIGSAFTLNTLLDNGIYTDRVRVYSAVHNTSGSLDFDSRLYVIGKWK